MDLRVLQPDGLADWRIGGVADLCVIISISRHNLDKHIVTNFILFNNYDAYNDFSLENASE